MNKIFKNAIFEYDKIDEDLILELNDYIDKHVDYIYNFFGNDIKREIPIIHIISTKKELDKIYCERNKVSSAPIWVIGFAGNNNIFYLSIKQYESFSHVFKSNNYEENLEYYKKTIIHEYIHFVNMLFNKKYDVQLTSKYLVEGIAMVLSKQNDNKNLYFNYSLEDILNSNNNYNGWYLVTKYIIENYSHEFIMELFKDKEKSRMFLIEHFKEIKDYYLELQKVK